MAKSYPPHSQLPVDRTQQESAAQALARCRLLVGTALSTSPLSPSPEPWVCLAPAWSAWQASSAARSWLISVPNASQQSLASEALRKSQGFFLLNTALEAQASIASFL